MSIEKNQNVEMNYELRISEDLIESNMEEDSIKFIYGTGQIIPGLEAGIADMNAGETKVVQVLAVDAYGEYDEELSQILPIADFEGIDLEIGMVLEGEGDEEGEEQAVIRATVTEVTEEDVTVDYNHPLAGCDLEFTVSIKSIA